MTLAKLKAAVFRRLKESSDSPVYWTEADVEEAINDGYEEMSDASEWYERSATINKLSYRTYYDLRTNLTDVFLSPRRCYNNQTSRWLEPISQRTLDFKTYRQWELNPGEPQMMFTRGLFWLGVYPKPGADSGTLTFYYSAMPAALSADGDVPGFPDEFHDGITAYALYELKYQERDMEISMSFYKEYQERETALSKYVNGRQSLDRSRAMAE